MVADIARSTGAEPAPGSHMLRSPALVAAFLLSLVRCDIAVVGSQPGEMPYRTEHFRIYYDTLDLTLLEIEAIALHKESLLVHVNEYLATDFDDTIVTIISDTISWWPHAVRYGETHETLAYAREDDGHEIAHVVSFRQWGYSNNPFLVEGVAVAAEVHDGGNATRAYAKEKLSSPDDTLSAYEQQELVERILFGDFRYVTSEYKRAGAFVHYVRATFGVEALRSWYWLTAGRGRTDWDEGFSGVFGKTPHEMAGDFSRDLGGYLPEAAAGLQ